MVIVNGQKFKITLLPQLYCISFCLYFSFFTLPKSFPSRHCSFSYSLRTQYLTLTFQCCSIFCASIFINNAWGKNLQFLCQTLSGG